MYSCPTDDDEVHGSAPARRPAQFTGPVLYQPMLLVLERRQEKC